MKIAGNTYDALLLETPPVPPETGGILGGTEGVVTHLKYDRGSCDRGKKLMYCPDTPYLENVIFEWGERGISFYGIFHSHRPHDRQLSVNDKQYIETIMFALPSDIASLYFPIVLPGDTMLVYRADRYGNTVHIVRDEIEIIKTEDGL